MKVALLLSFSLTRSLWACDPGHRPSISFIYLFFVRSRSQPSLQSTITFSCNISSIIWSKSQQWCESRCTCMLEISCIPQWILNYNFDLVIKCDIRVKFLSSLKLKYSKIRVNFYVLASGSFVLLSYATCHPFPFCFQPYIKFSTN